MKLNYTTPRLCDAFFIDQLSIVPPYCDYNACHIIEVTNVHEWWNPRVFQGSYVISALEHPWKPWGTL